MRRQFVTAFAYGRQTALPGVPKIDQQRAECIEVFQMMAAAGQYHVSEFGGWFEDSWEESRKAWNERPAARALLARMQPGDVLLVARKRFLLHPRTDPTKTFAVLADAGVTLKVFDFPVDVTPESGDQLLAAIESFKQYFQHPCRAGRSE